MTLEPRSDLAAAAVRGASPVSRPPARTKRPSRGACPAAPLPVVARADGAPRVCALLRRWDEPN